MPYDSNADLPDNVRNVLPAAAQSIWRNAFNSSYKEDGDEDKARRMAWGAVKKSYKKNEDGEWVKKD